LVIRDIQIIMLKLIKYDINIQLRSGYWTVYGIVGFIYILILFNFPLSIRNEIAAYLIFTDTSVLGLIFVGALVLFEKQQGVIQSMSVTPLKLNQYLFSKVISITILSVIVSSLIWIIPLWSFKGYFLILPGVILSSVIFTLFGIGFTAGADSFNKFLARVFLGSMIFLFPIILVFLFPRAVFLIVLPMNAIVNLFVSITKETFSYLQLLDILILIIWGYIMLLFAQKQFRKFNLFI
jgi:fluoroquinolone transport system permease protein